VSLLLLPLLAAVVYFAEGSPGLPDQPLAQRGDAAAMASAQRPSQAEAESRVSPPGLPDTQEARDYAAMIDRLAEVVAERPEDEQGLRMLADGRFRLQRYAEAWPVYARLAEIRGPRADAALVARQAEAMVLAAGGMVTAEAEQVIDRALDLDRRNPTARFLDGLRHAQAGRLDPAMAVWEPLMQDAPADAQWRPWLRDMLSEARRLSRGGGAPGPDADQMAAAQNLSPEERMEMIEGMVTRLETRLTERGGGPEDWVRLIRALSVLGRDDDARRIYDLSQQELKGSEAGFVREQALAMGVIEG
jgi:cytochrome c-type biogenesis protein CcmH